MDSDIVIPDHIMEQYFRLKNQADEYLNTYIRHYRAEQIGLEKLEQEELKSWE